MVCAAPTQPRQPRHPLPDHGCRGFQIRVRGAKPAPVANGHRHDAGNITCKGHQPVICRMHNASKVSSNVDAPMSAILPDWCEASDQLTIDRVGEARTSAVRDDETANQRNRYEKDRASLSATASRIRLSGACVRRKTLVVGRGEC